MTINLNEGENVTCTFTNTRSSRTCDHEVGDRASYSAVGQVITYTIVATNDGNTTLAAVTVTDPKVSASRVCRRTVRRWRRARR